MGQPLQERTGSNWETLKDKVKESLGKVVEAVGTYSAAPDDLGLIPNVKTKPEKKRRVTRKAAVAKRPAAKGATASKKRTGGAKTTKTAKRARKSA